MPVPAVIATAASEYQFNNGFLENAVKDLSPEEWLRRPEDHANHIAWIVGHLVWSRKQVLRRLGSDWSAPWLGMFARGEKLDPGIAYPSPDTLMAGWRETAATLMETLENISEEALAVPATQPGPPSADGKLSGTVGFIAWHETYHLGQVCYLSSWLGHQGLMG